MSRSLPSVEITRTFIDESFDAQAPVMTLRWADKEASQERIWEFPDGLSILSGAPDKFGVRVRRQEADSYFVAVLWNQTQFSWNVVSRVDLLSSSLATLLGAVGIDLWSLLEQPLPSVRMRRWAA